MSNQKAVQQALAQLKDTQDSYVWTNNIACVSCYKILARRGQFNEFQLPFQKAGDCKLKALNYFVTSGGRHMLEMSAFLLSQRYVQMLSTDYVVRPELKDITWADVQVAMVSVLQDGDKTIRNLAHLVDIMISFKDE